MKLLIATSMFGAALALTASAAPPDQITPEEKAKIGLVPLEGGYSIASGERDGKAIPESEFKGLIVRFTRTEMIGTKESQKNLYGAEYTLDTTKSPWKITLKSAPPMKPFPCGMDLKEGLLATGLVKKDDGGLTLVYALPGGETPTEFKTKEKQQMLVLKHFANSLGQPNKFPEQP